MLPWILVAAVIYASLLALAVRQAIQDHKRRKAQLAELMELCKYCGTEGQG